MGLVFRGGLCFNRNMAKAKQNKQRVLYMLIGNLMGVSSQLRWQFATRIPYLYFDK